MRYFSYIILCSLLMITACNKETPLPEPDYPILRLTGNEVLESEVDLTTNVVVELDGSIDNNVVVEYSTVPKSASSGADYVGIVGELIFKPGETSKIIPIVIKGDEVVENTETFDFVLLNPINAIMEDNRTTISILDNDDGSGNALTIPDNGYTTPMSYSGMSLVWSDEFDENALNSNNWTQEIGNGDSGWGNNELQYYKGENTYFANSDYLIIEAREENQSGFDYTSSRMITEGKQEFQYGRIDIRAALPEGQGLWPALWMLGSDFRTNGWPICGEIDIMEQVGFQPNLVHGTVHYGSSFAQRGSKTAFRGSPSGNDFKESFHVYSLIWEEDHIEILVDDVKYLDVVPADLGGQPWPYNQPFFFIFNVAVGGNWPGSPDDNTVFPQRMIVDYVRVFQ